MKSSKIIFFTFLILLFGIGIFRTCFAQEKDSTMIKFWINELNQTQFRLAQLDSAKIGEIRLLNYQYQKFLEEQKKLNEKR